tara:strand:+ start:760 stop:1098 length:339 start_codon:yes stop_codon:yes gene_type:complete
MTGVISSEHVTRHVLGDGQLLVMQLVIVGDAQETAHVILHDTIDGLDVLHVTAAGLGVLHIVVGGMQCDILGVTLCELAGDAHVYVLHVAGEAITVGSTSAGGGTSICIFVT